MPQNFQVLIDKLDEFIRKYYRNQLLKGLILFLAILLVSFLVVNSLEYFGHFGPILRTILFYLFILSNIGVFIFYIADPLLKMNKIGKRISFDQAAIIIGKHFPEIQDKLLNTLQLQREAELSGSKTDLLFASIDQKISRMKPIPFISAIDLSKNKKFLRYALPPLFIVLILFLVSPSFITRPSERIIYHSRVYIKEMPFHLTILNKKLEAFQQEDFTLHVKVTGEQLPDEVFIESEGITSKLSRENKILFSYTFKTLQKDRNFRLIAGKYKSPEYELKVFPKPTILNFDAELKYPAYLNRKYEILENTGDLVIPEGTNITWKFYTKDVDNIFMCFDTVTKVLSRTKSNAFEYTSGFSKNQRYYIYSKNAWVKSTDSLAFTITVIPDSYPSITMNELKDSSMQSRIFFQGVIKDDYGFSRLSFHFTLYPGGDTTQKVSRTEDLPVNGNVNQQQFYYSVEPSAITENPGDEADYFFEVCDNDGIHGPKCTRTALFRYKAPTFEEIENLADQAEQNITKDLESNLKAAKQLQKQIDELNKKLVDKSTLTWQDKKQIEELIEKEKQIKENLDKIQQQNEQKNRIEEQYRKTDSSIMEKQKKLNELFDQVMDDEMKKMIEQLREMLDKIDKNQVSQMLEKMKYSNKDLEKQLDRSLEIFKQLEFEKDLSETIEKLNKLGEKEDKLSENTAGKEKEEDKDRLLEEQKDINKEFDDLNRKMDELEEKNKALEEPNSFPDLDKEQQGVKDELENSEQSLQKNARKDASRSQKNASRGMKSMAQKLEEMKEGMEEEQMAEDTEKLRQILENLVRISFEQEDLMNRTKTINRNDPKYLALIQEQNELKEDLSMVEDSLYQLAKRQIMIKPYIMREVSAINRNVQEAVDNMNDRNIPAAGAKQQFVMTSVNNLALLLSEALKQMENNMNMQAVGKGKATCNPKGAKGKMSMKTMRQMQEQLNQQMESLKKQMESQMKQGQGNMSKQGNQKISESLARLAAEQEAIRNEMKKYIDQMNEEGAKNTGELNNAMQQMEETEKDLVNKRILQETLNRQQQILTRLLESEKAEQKREQEERRQSTEAKNQKYSNQNANFQYNIKKTQSTELIKTVQPAYNHFYKNKINSYFLKFER